jgi:hypothetical protein
VPGNLRLVADAQFSEGLDELFARLRQEWGSLPPSRTTIQGRPIARAVRVDDSDTAEDQSQGAKVADPEVCDNEGWVIRGLIDAAGHGDGSDLPVPISVWCSRPTGHGGDHEARIGRSRQLVDVVRWTHAP